MRRNKEINRPLKRYIAQWVGVGIHGRVVWAIKQENGYPTVIYYMYFGAIYKIVVAVFVLWVGASLAKIVNSTEFLRG